MLLRDRENGLFYRRDNTWTNDPEQAFDFQYSAGLPQYDEVLALRSADLVVLPRTGSRFRPSNTLLGEMTNEQEPAREKESCAASSRQ